MVGNKSRVRRLKKNLSEQGIPESKLESLHVPIGLDIKAKTPTELAVSIIAEVICAGCCHCACSRVFVPDEKNKQASFVLTCF